MATTQATSSSVSDETEPFNPRILILAIQAADQASLLSVMVKTYIALEKLISHEEDALERASARSGLGSLMRGLNAEMERQVEALLHSTTTLSASVASAAGVR